MEMAEKMDTGHNQIKKRRQSGETVSTVFSGKIILMNFCSDVSRWSEWTPFVLILSK